MVFDTDYGESTAAGVLTSAPPSARGGDEGEGGVGNELTPTAPAAGAGEDINITVLNIMTTDTLILITFQSSRTTFETFKLRAPARGSRLLHTSV